MLFGSVQHVPQLAVCAPALIGVCSRAMSWYLAKKYVILCEPPCIWQGSQTDRLGCMSAISSAWLPECFSLVPPSSLRLISLLPCFSGDQQGKGYFSSIRLI